jgi:precorrin-2/cobalt-factor-2 C20-methyltransferase
MSRLVGVGVGPGDPDLVTVRAVRVLTTADVILVPDTAGNASRGQAAATDVGRAEAIVRACAPDTSARIVRVPFTMGDPTGVTPRRAAAWAASAEATVAAFESGASVVAFATIGDPSVYSTFSYLAASVQDRLPEVAVEVVPGITAMQALAAASRTPLVEGDEILALVPLKDGVERFRAAAAVADTVVVYKAGRHLAALRSELAGTAGGAQAIAGVDVGLPAEQVCRLAELQSAPYFTTIICPPDRGEIGGRL